MGLPLSRRGQSGSNGRLSFEQAAGRRSGPEVLFPSHPAAWRPEGDQLGRLRRLPSGRGQTQSGWYPTAPRVHPIEQVFEQCSGTGSSPDKTASPADARVEAIRDIELAEKIKKQQFNLKPLTGKAATARELWAAVLAA